MSLALFLSGYAISQTTPKLAPEAKVIPVSNVREFLEAIGPDRTIQMKAGTYRLELTDAGDRKFLEWEKAFDGYQLKLRNLSNLTILGVDKEPAKLLIKPSYAYVLTLSKCQNIRLANLTLGHSPEPGACTGGGVRLDNCKTIVLNKLDLFGCGTDGLNLTDVEALTLTDSTIHDCTVGAVWASGCTKLRFTNSNFFDNKGFDTFFAFLNSADVYLDKCLIRSNSNEPVVMASSLFQVGPRSVVLLKDCRIEKNHSGVIFDVEPAGSLAVTGGSISANEALSLAYKPDPKDPNKPVLTLKDVDIKDNKFRRGTYSERDEIEHGE